MKKKIYQIMLFLAVVFAVVYVVHAQQLSLNQAVDFPVDM